MALTYSFLQLMVPDNMKYSSTKLSNGQYEPSEVLIPESC
uniref:Uncharacterized protein n=1 Tax=Arundo donax TaxID=35708 RepID=A0A0A9AC70_ARUDO